MIRLSLKLKNIFFIISFFLITFFVFYIISDLWSQAEKTIYYFRFVNSLTFFLKSKLFKTEVKNWPEALNNMEKAFPFFEGVLYFKNKRKISFLKLNLPFLKRSSYPKKGLYYYDDYIIVVDFFKGEPIYFVFSAVPFSFNQFSKVRTFFLVGSILFFFALMVSLFISKVIIDPLQKILSFAKRVSEGKLEEKLKVETGDEIEDLAKAIDRMKEALALKIEQLSKQNKFIEKIFSLLPGGIAVLDENFKLLKCNQKMKSIFPEIDCLNITQYLKENFVYHYFEREYPLILKDLKEGVYEVNLKGENRYFLFSLAILDEFSEGKYIIIFNEITTLKEYEKVFFQMRRMALLGEMNLKLAHEIKNPLVTMNSLSQLMLEEDFREEERKEMLNKILQEGKRLLEVLTNFSQFWKDSDDLEKAEINLKKTVEYIFELFKLAVKKKKIIFSISIPEKVVIYSNPNLFKQVILNIIKNGVDAVEEVIEEKEGKIEVSFQDNFLIIANNGPMIEKDKLNKIFVPFFSTKAKGSGLGLSIVKDIADKLGIEIIVESSKEKTIFKLDLRRIIN